MFFEVSPNKRYAVCLDDMSRSKYWSYLHFNVDDIIDFAGAINIALYKNVVITIDDHCVTYSNSKSLNALANRYGRVLCYQRVLLCIWILDAAMIYFFMMVR